MRETRGTQLVGSVATLAPEENPDWGSGMLALAESLSTHSAYLYRYRGKEGSLVLISRSSDDEEIPLTLSASDGTLNKILASAHPFYNQTRKFAPLFTRMRSPYLVLSSLRYEGRILGLLVVSSKRMPSRDEVQFLSTKALHFSLLLAIEDLENEKLEWRTKANQLEAKLETAYQRVRESDQLASLGQFAGGLAHEFNTPLGAIQTYTEYLELFGGGNADAVEGILKAVSHCREIVENVLRLSRSKTEEFEPISLRRVIEDALWLTEPEMKKRAISVGFEMLADPTVPGNHTRLVQVVANLLNNARDSFSGGRLLPRAGDVKITLGRDEANAVLEVSDNGPGISKAILGSIFNPFFTTKDVGQGTGLGLSITHAIVQEHSGTIEVLSDEGKGTKAIVKIPLEVSRLGETARR